MARKRKNKPLWFEPGELPTWVEEEEDLESRLEHYSEAKRATALEVENIFKSGDEELVLEHVKPQLVKTAYRYAYRWNNYRVSEADFESAFWEESWKVFSNYSWRGGDGKYLLYETLVLAWDREAKDVARRATKTLKGQVNHKAVPLADYFDEVTPDTRINVEEQVVFELAIAQFIQESLNSKEKTLMKVVMGDPSASLRELQSIVGYSKDTVSRTLKRIGQKLIDEGITDRKGPPF